MFCTVQQCHQKHTVMECRHACEAAVSSCAIDDPTDLDVAPSSRPQDSTCKLKLNSKDVTSYMEQSFLTYVSTITKISLYMKKALLSKDFHIMTS